MNYNRKRGQVTLFIIVAVLLIAAVAGYFLVREKLTIREVPQELRPAYEYFISCLENEAKEAAKLAGVQAGYLYLPDFEPGSAYMPFSSQLEFMGFSVPYWYYVSGNGLAKEQVPTLQEIQEQFARYIAEQATKCDFSVFEEQGYRVETGNAKAKVKISETRISITLEMPLTISKGDAIAKINEHRISIRSKFGKFYNTAKKIYQHERRRAFLENYALDVLRLYAPVDGAELSCSPMVWNAANVTQELLLALEANIQAIKLRDSDYKLAKEEHKYFVQNIDTGGENVQFLFSHTWPLRVEIWPAQNGIMIAKPMGTQAGLGVLGFCYVQYHFVYDLVFPVLVQIYSGDEVFQFPVAVVIEKNVGRNASMTESIELAGPEICDKANTIVTVYTYDTGLHAVPANISFRCLDTECYIGETKISGDDAKLTALFPQCVNGLIVARSHSYEETKKYISTNKQTSVNLVMDKLYNLSIEILADGKQIGGQAFITFSKGDGKSITVAYPLQQSIELSQGLYNISVVFYRNGSIRIPESETTRCIEVPQKGVLGFFGLTREECFTIRLPAQELSMLPGGGGNVEYYFSEEQLRDASKIIIDIEAFSVPSSIEELADIYTEIENAKAIISVM